MTGSILIVDDEYGLADILADILREEGLEVRVAINGEAGLAALAEAAADVVLTDMMMPIMNGPEMIRRMRERPETADIPVVLMTAIPDSADRSWGYYALLRKPFELKEVMALLKELLPRE